jgi:hypothetical protein
LPALFHNQRKHSLKIIPDVLGTDAEGKNSLLGSPRVSTQIVLRNGVKIVSEPIDLNRKARFMTEEVENIRPHGMLAAELVALRTRLQRTP